MLTQLVGRQRLRADQQSWLVDALGLATRAGYAHVRAGADSRALVHGDRFAATGDPAGLDTAVAYIGTPCPSPATTTTCCT